VRAYDPEGVEQARGVLQNVTLFDSAFGCIEGADALVIVTEWNEFRALDLRRAKTLLKSPIIVDLRNIYRAEEMARLGFSYTSVGRPASGPAE
jgi:UDPglucose 6-dehydrogenase